MIINPEELQIGEELKFKGASIGEFVAPKHYGSQTPEFYHVVIRVNILLIETDEAE